MSIRPVEIRRSLGAVLAKRGLTTPARPRLLIVADSLQGGLGAVVRAHVAWFATSGWDVDVGSNEDARIPTASSHIVPTPTTVFQAIGVVRSARDLRTLVKELKPDVVHCHGARSLLVARIAAVPTFVTLHGFGALPHEFPARDLVRRVGIRIAPFLAVRAFSVAPGTPGRWQFLPHASPQLRHLSRASVERRAVTPTFLWLGRLEPPKRPELFVHGLALARRHSVLRGVVAGAGSLETSVRSLARRIDAPIDFVGEVSDVARLIEDAWAVVVFSRFEGVPFAVEEAMWMERGVVASPLPGLHWLLGKEAMFAATPDAAAKAFIRLSEPETAAAYGRFCAERIRRVIDPDMPWPTLEKTYDDYLRARAST